MMYLAQDRRDAREAEGARLEIVYSANNGIEGSTPSLSAMLDRNKTKKLLSLGERIEARAKSKGEGEVIKSFLGECSC